MSFSEEKIKDACRIFIQLLLSTTPMITKLLNRRYYSGHTLSLAPRASFPIGRSEIHPVYLIIVNVITI